MLQYASKERLVIFMILSAISVIGMIVSTVLSILFDNLVYVCAAFLVAGTIQVIWALLMKLTNRKFEPGIDV